MTAKGASPQVVLLLLVVGTACFSMRTSFQHKQPTIAPGDSAWRLTYTTTFHARKPHAQIKAAFPENTRHSHVFENKLLDSELTVVRNRPTRAAGKRDIVARAPKTGQFNFVTQFDIHLSRRGGWHPDQSETAISADDRAKYLNSEKGIEVSNPAVTAALAPLLEGQASKDELVERLFEHCLADIMPGGDAATQDAAEALAKGSASSLGRARALVALCRAAKIPARLVTGFEIKAGKDVLPHNWVEVLSSGQWEPYDPDNGYARDIPYYFMPVRRDGLDVVRVSDASDVAVKYSIARLPPPGGKVDPAQRHPLDILDLTQLPFKLHEPVELVLLLPLGALITAVFRTIIGVRTFGTFSPTLLALAFIFNDRRTGLVVFASVLIMGFTSRSLLDRLKLLLVPRLGIILTLIVLLMVFGISLTSYFHWSTTGEIVLLPMVILTMLVEHFYITTEEDSMRFGLQLLVSTFALGFIVYLLLRWKAVGHILLVYPELHCFTVVALILIGRYTGYRWTELWRFRDMVAPAGPEKP